MALIKVALIKVDVTQPLNYVRMRNVKRDGEVRKQDPVLVMGYPAVTPAAASPAPEPSPTPASTEGKIDIEKLEPKRDLSPAEIEGRRKQAERKKLLRQYQ